MQLSIFGLGYVGPVSAGCLAGDHNYVIGVDPNETKVDLINRGLAPIVEPHVKNLIAENVRDGRLQATTSVHDAVSNSQMSMICVGTPSQLNGNLDLSHVRRVCEQIGQVLAHKAGYHIVVARSTMLPGSMESVVVPTLEAASGRRAGTDFGVCSNPEFLREGTAVRDFYNPPKTVIGENTPHDGDLLAELYAKIDAPLIRTSVKVAEMVKYADNNWHALKVAFANEIGTIAKAAGLDGRQVMQIFCEDRKLNLSEYYLKPGFAFGGSCLPKDVRALTYKARSLDLDVPVLNSIMVSNRIHIERALELIASKQNRRIGILGFAFKATTDDLRESPVVELVERLIGKGYDLRLYDRNVNMAALTGANRDYILNHIPHISRLMVSSTAEVIDFGDTIVVGNAAEEFRSAAEQVNSGKVIVDLVRILDRDSGGSYEGMCW